MLFVQIKMYSPQGTKSIVFYMKAYRVFCCDRGLPALSLSNGSLLSRPLGALPIELLSDGGDVGGGCISARTPPLLGAMPTALPHSGQKRDPGRTGVPHVVQNLSVALNDVEYALNFGIDVPPMLCAASAASGRYATAVGSLNIPWRGNVVL